MSDIVVTLKYQTKHANEEIDVALPKAVPFQQLASILGRELDIPELKVLSETSSVSGRINGKLIVRPHETLETVHVSDGSFLEFIVTNNPTRDGVEKDITTKGAHLRSLDTNETFACVGQFIRIGRSRRHTIAVGHLPNAAVVSDSNGHATILLRGGSYFIRDENSTNGTSIEGVELRPHEQVPLRDGAKIQLGHDGPILYFYTS